MAASASWAICPECHHPVAEHTAMRGWVTEITVIVVCMTCKLLGQPGTCLSLATER